MKNRWFVLIMALTLLIFPLLQPVALAEAEAENLTESLIISLSDGGSGKAGNLLDKSYKSGWRSGKGGGEVTLQTPPDKPMSGIYLMWDRLPEYPQFAVKIQGVWQELNVPVQGLLHQYIHLDAAEGFRIRSTDPMALCGLRAYGPGTLPGDVQHWSPPCEKADLLLIPTHPDDEHLFFGGTMPVYAGQYKKKVQVVYLTDPNPLRRHEALDGLYTVGVRNAPVFAPFEDILCKTLEEAKGKYSEKEVIGWQVEMIRRFKPLAIVGHDVRGEYGHGVHRLNAQSLMEAVPAAADENAYPGSVIRYGLWDTPKCYLHIWDENNRLLDWDQPLSFFGGKTGYEMAAQGFLCHVSQQNGYHEMSKKGRRDCRSFGLFRSLVGEDTALNDFLENTPEALFAPVTTTTAPVITTTAPVTTTIAPQTAAQPPATSSVTETAVAATTKLSATGTVSALAAPVSADQDPDDSSPLILLMLALVAIAALILLLIALRRSLKKARHAARR